MWNLVYKEIVQLRSYLIQTLGFLAVAILLFGRLSPVLMMSYLYVFPVVMAMTLAQLAFTQEERGNTFAFLRSLPIRPREIVGAKYVVSVLVTLAFVVVLAVAGPAGAASGTALLAAISTVTLVSFLLAAVSYFLHFWLGVKSARVALILLSFVAAIPMMLVLRSGPRGVSAFFAERLSGLTSLAGSPGGVALAFLLGLAVLFVSYAASAKLFASRDLCPLP